MGTGYDSEGANGLETGVRRKSSCASLRSAVPCHAVLSCAVLCCAMLFYAVLSSALLCCALMCCALWWCNVFLCLLKSVSLNEERTCS